MTAERMTKEIVATFGVGECWKRTNKCTIVMGVMLDCPLSVGNDRCGILS